MRRLRRAACWWCLAISCVALEACAAGSNSNGSSSSGAVVNGPTIGASGSTSIGQGALGMSPAGINSPSGASVLPPSMQVGSSGSGPAASAPGAGGASAAKGPAAAGGAGMMGAGAKTPVVMVTPNQMLPPVTDYNQPGPFNPMTEVDNTGPGGAFTLYRPTSLDSTPGFKFVPATWGNGIGTTPQTYWWFNGITSHGFVMIASNSSSVTSDDMTQGLDWLIQQNDMPGELQGKLDTSRAVCVGYSLGGQASVGCGAHPKVIATVSMHPAGGTPLGLHAPLLLFTGTNDTVCVPATFVQPIFDASPVPTFYGTIDGADHLEPTPIGGNRETAPTTAWLRLWVFGDQGAKSYFYGPDCILCKAPWTNPQSKMLQ